MRAARAAFLVDGAAYFGALADALEQARRSVLMLGWDFHSGVDLRPGEAHGPRPQRLAALLDALARERPELEVRVLGWDFAMLYALEREFLPRLRFQRTHRRVRFALDAHHPLGASHHQKLVVIDDALAFIGGFDLTTHRWDTPEHRPRDPRRRRPDGSPYGPFHDVQMAVDGSAAQALGELARARWERATGERLDAPAASADPWPPALAPDVRDAVVGVARTEPALAGRREVREVEALYLRSIAAARRWLYLENQYLTSPRIAEALAARLREPGGPEVLIVAPERGAGWLEETTMDVLRGRVVRALREADGEDRLRIYFPFVPGLPDGQFLNVHAKVMIVDDALARVGSSNLSSRSMGLDTECDLALEAGDDPCASGALAGLRARLLGEHLGVAPAAVAEATREHGSLVRAVEALRGEGRSLRPLEVSQEASWAPDAVRALGVADPAYPMPLEELVDGFTAQDRELSRRSAWWRLAGVAAALLLLALVWRATPVSEWVTPERLGALALRMERMPWGPPLAVAVFVATSLLMVPVTALIVAAAIALGPWLGFGVSLAGSLVSAGIGYGLGRVAWRGPVRRLAGRRLRVLSRRLAARGVLSTAILRLAPVAPFTVVNLVAGASPVGLRAFLVGTLVGMGPGIAALTLAAGQVAGALREPSTLGWVVAGLAVAAAAALGVWLRLIARRRVGGA